MKLALIALAIAAIAIASALYKPEPKIALEIRDNLTVRIPLDVWEPRP